MNGDRMNTPIADMVAQMLAAGVPHEMVILAVQTAELSGGHSAEIPVDTAAERRRAYDRKRKASKRNSTGHSTGIPPDSENALSLSSPPSISEIQERKKERKRGSKIPPDWQPNVGHVTAGRQLGFSEKQVFEQAEDMRLWARSNEHRAVARKSDWDMTFLGWLRRNKPKQADSNGKSSGKSVLDAFDRLEQRLAGGDDHASGENGLFRLPPR